MNKIILIIVSLMLSSAVFAQSSKFQLSSHILDITSGKPADKVRVLLQKLNSDNSWKDLQVKYTDDNGRIGDFLPLPANNEGTYRLTFYTESYFKKKKMECFYPFIEIVFKITNNSHYHVPISLSPFGYSTYRGS